MKRLVFISMCATGAAHAGMTSIVLSDLAEARIEVISFFIVVYLLLTFVVKFLWNRLAKEISAIPQIGFRKTLCLMLVSGLFMYVILTMISGARELMTPGAWEKQGISYRLSQGENDPRKRKIRKLKEALWRYAEENEGSYPTGQFDEGFPKNLWKMPDGVGLYSFLPLEAPGQILVFEPASAGKERYVILEDGRIQQWSGRKIEKEITKGK